MTDIRRTLNVLAIVAALTLAGCSSEQGNTPAPAAPEASAATGVPLTADQVNVQMTLEGAPMLSTTGQFVAVTVKLVNHGKTTLTSKGTYPVNLGAHSADANGKIVNRDLARAAIPVITPDGQATVTIQLPVNEIIGKSADILPVQEGVAWFDKWGTKPLIVGPFSTCTSPTTGVCDASGKPLAIAVN